LRRMDGTFLADTPGALRPALRLGCDGTATPTRPAAVRLTKVDGGLRIRCYIGFVCVIDFTDTVAPIYSGNVGMISGNWSPPYFDDFEIWQNPPPASSLFFLK